MGQWLFHPRDPKTTHRESTISAFFASNAIESGIQAIIREGIQNALDAPVSQNEQVRVRIHLSGMEGALSYDTIQEFFASGVDHWNAPNNGLTQSKSNFLRPCPYLVFEDFGTSGLEGDERVAHTSNDVKNHFYNFFRAEGQSDKDANNRGSWGVGKHVFPMYSTIKTFFGFTVRQSDKRQMLMGKTILRMHKIEENYSKMVISAFVTTMTVSRFFLFRTKELWDDSSSVFVCSAIRSPVSP